MGGFNKSNRSEIMEREYSSMVSWHHGAKSEQWSDSAFENWTKIPPEQSDVA